MNNLFICLVLKLFNNIVAGGLRFEAYVNSKTAGRAYENCGDSSQTSITALSLAHRLFGIQRFSYNFRDVADVSAVEIRLNSSHQEFISHDNSSGDSSCTAMGKCDMIQRVGAPSNVAQIMHYTSTEERLNSASTKKFISTEADHLSSLSVSSGLKSLLTMVVKVSLFSIPSLNK